jgi:structural maintenance of chromosome 4
MNLSHFTESQTSSNAGRFSKPFKTDRVVISCIEIENFKSYAGRHIMDKLGCQFTAFAGDNGTGKSNLLDALLFGLGSEASRLRMRTANELIHRSVNHEPS